MPLICHFQLITIIPQLLCEGRTLFGWDICSSVILTHIREHNLGYYLLTHPLMASPPISLAGIQSCGSHTRWDQMEVLHNITTNFQTSLLEAQ